MPDTEYKMPEFHLTNDDTDALSDADMEKLAAQADDEFDDALARIATGGGDNQPYIDEVLMKLLAGEDLTGGEYDKFTGQAAITQGIKDVMRLAKNWPMLSADKKEVLEIIACKMGRILNDV